MQLTTSKTGHFDAGWRGVYAWEIGAIWGLGEASERRGTQGKEGLDLRNFVKESTGCGLCGWGQADRFTDAVT